MWTVTYSQATKPTSVPGNASVEFSGPQIVWSSTGSNCLIASEKDGKILLEASAPDTNLEPEEALMLADAIYEMTKKGVTPYSL